eukprot:TRINITY_DN7101_c0_g1_i4.p1 TRINITY_DN7101_c0_g1~~TRINITY_DN7101_c0_g1_i4.p1  ORF type:complete len:968 (+),score=266.98 TRINITY_DN7101_c0_g1_i4:88-2904(+)
MEAREDSGAQAGQGGTRRLDARAPNGLACMSICRCDNDEETARVAIGGEKMLAIVEAKRRPGEDLPSLKLTRRFGSAKKAQNVIRISDVKWHPKKPALVATGSSTGMIFLWDVPTGTPTPLKHAHHTATTPDHIGPGWGVKRVCWHTKQESLLLSACTDSTVKLWDTRTHKEKAPSTFRLGPEGQNLWIKDVEVDPFDENSFVCCNENAELLYWDLRMPDRKPKRRIPASTETSGKGAINSLNWHPTRPGVLATGSKDYSMRVWDLLQPPPDAQREISPSVTISTLASVGRVHWRPSLGGHSHQIAEVSLSPLDVDLNIWDQMCEHLPLCCVRKPHGVVITDLEWWDPNGELIFSTSKSGSFAVSSVKHAYVHTAEMCTSSAAWGPGGRLAFHNDAVHIPEAGRCRAGVAWEFPASRASSPASQAMSSPPLERTVRHREDVASERSVVPREKQGFFSKLFGNKPPRASGERQHSTASARAPVEPKPMEKPAPPRERAPPPQTYPHVPPVPKGCVNGNIYSVETGVEDEARFARLAEEYILSDRPPRELCAHNAAAARAAAPHDTQLHELWELVTVLCEVAEALPPPHTPARALALEAAVAAAAVAFAAAGVDAPPVPPVEPPRERSNRQARSSVDRKGQKRRARRTSAQLQQATPRSATSSDGYNLADHESAGAPARSGGMEHESVRGAEDLLTGYAPMDGAPAIAMGESDGSEWDDDCTLADVKLGDHIPPSLLDSDERGSPECWVPVPAVEHDALGVAATAGGAFDLDLPAQLLAVIEQLLEVGDVQTVATMVCSVRGAPGAFDYTKYAARGAEWFMGYYDLLCASGLILSAADLLRHCPFSRVHSISQSGTSVVAKCRCRNPPSTQPTGLDSKQMLRSCCYATRLCCVCLAPVTGMYIWASNCMHGGHFACMHKWYHTLGMRGCPHPDCGREAAA